MEYRKTVRLKDGRECVLRSGRESDGGAVLTCFLVTHEETDNLLAYPDESTMTAEQEAEFLGKKAEDPRGVMLLAEVDGELAGTAGIDPVGEREKIRHRAEFGIGIFRKYWGLGIGRALLEACVECAEKAGYEQLELSVVADNEKAIGLYKSVGFTEYGRNPKGFRSRSSGWQELVYMRKEL